MTQHVLAAACGVITICLGMIYRHDLKIESMQRKLEVLEQ